MYNYQKNWGRSHLSCPICGHNDCFSEFEGSNGMEGYCHSCRITVNNSQPSFQYNYNTNPPHKQTQNTKEIKTVPFSEVDETTVSYSPVLYEFFERSGMLINDGYTKTEADTVALSYTNNTADDLLHHQLEYHTSIGNNFGVYLLNITKDFDILAKYSVGFSYGYTVFWYRDKAGNYINAKKIKYCSDGHRDKNSNPFFLYKSKDGFSHCLYNEHFLSSDKSKPVILVESEKSAILANHFYQNYLWLATGGSNNLTKNKAKALYGRKVFILYDNDDAGYNAADNAVQTLSGIVSYANVLNPQQHFGSAIPNGYDIGDFIDDSNSNSQFNSNNNLKRSSI